MKVSWDLTCNQRRCRVGRWTYNKWKKRSTSRPRSRRRAAKIDARKRYPDMIITVLHQKCTRKYTINIKIKERNTRQWWIDLFPSHSALCHSFLFFCLFVCPQYLRGGRVPEWDSPSFSIFFFFFYKMARGFATRNFGSISLAGCGWTTSSKDMNKLELIQLAACHIVSSLHFFTVPLRRISSRSSSSIYVPHVTLDARFRLQWPRSSQ